MSKKHKKKKKFEAGHKAKNKYVQFSKMKSGIMMEKG